MKERKKILRFISRMNVGGPALHVTLLTKYLEDEYETLLVSGMLDKGDKHAGYLAEEKGINVRYIHHISRDINPFQDYLGYRAIKKIIRGFKPDIVHTHTGKSGALGRLAAYHLKVPHVVHTYHGHFYHSYFSSFTTNVLGRIERYLANRTEKIIVISPKQLKELSEDFPIAPKEKFIVVPLGFELGKFFKDTETKRKKFRTQFSISDDTIAVGLVGRMVPVKNHGMFLKVIAALQEKISDKKIKFLLIGDGYLRPRIEKMIDELQIRNLVTLTSWIENIEEVIAGLDIVALTSLNEGTPVSLVEALAGKKAIISTKVGGIEDFVEDNVSGYLVPVNDVKMFSEKMLVLINDKEKRILFGESGQKNVENLFSHERLIRDMKNLYEKLLRNS